MSYTRHEYKRNVLNIDTLDFFEDQDNFYCLKTKKVCEEDGLFRVNIGYINSFDDIQSCGYYDYIDITSYDLKHLSEYETNEVKTLFSKYEKKLLKLISQWEELLTKNIDTELVFNDEEQEQFEEIKRELESTIAQDNYMDAVKSGAHWDHSYIETILIEYNKREKDDDIIQNVLNIIEYEEANINFNNFNFITFFNEYLNSDESDWGGGLSHSFVFDLIRNKKADYHFFNNLKNSLSDMLEYIKAERYTEICRELEEDTEMDDEEKEMEKQDAMDEVDNDFIYLHKEAYYLIDNQELTAYYEAEELKDLLSNAIQEQETTKKNTTRL